MADKKFTFTVKELKELTGINKSVGRMNTQEVKSAQTALALVRSGVDFASERGKKLKELAMDLRDRAICLQRKAVEGRYVAPAAGRTGNSLAWKTAQQASFD